jgi:acetylornithine deacetylase/succinyl-diaminopimelate desuccinylase-like protein
MFRAITAAARARYPDALVTTVMLAGFTDSHYFRRMGIASYGLGPFPLTQNDSRGVHGNDERLSIEALRFGVRFYYDVVARVAAK